MKLKEISNEDKDYVLNNYKNICKKELAEKLKISINSLSWLFKNLGIATRRLKRWSEKDKQFLNDNYKIMTTKELCSILNRGEGCLYSMAIYMKLSKLDKLNITEDSLKLEYMNNKSIKDIAIKYNVTFYRIYGALIKYNIIPGTRQSGTKNPQWMGYGELSGSHWATIKKHAKNRNLEFNITIEQVWDLFLKQDRKCALSGIILTFGQERIDRYTGTTASLDRIDSCKGYEINNVQWVHKHINHMKLQTPQEEFIKWCGLIYSHNKKENQCI